MLRSNICVSSVSSIRRSLNFGIINLCTLCACVADVRIGGYIYTHAVPINLGFHNVDDDDDDDIGTNVNKVSGLNEGW